MAWFNWWWAADKRAANAAAGRAAPLFRGLDRRERARQNAKWTEEQRVWIPRLIERFGERAAEMLEADYLGSLDVDTEEFNERLKQLRFRAGEALGVEEKLHLIFAAIKGYNSVDYMNNFPAVLQRWEADVDPGG
jgi:hypothetical protein